MNFAVQYFGVSVNCTICTSKNPSLNIRGSCPSDNLDVDYRINFKEKGSGRYSIGERGSESSNERNKIPGTKKEKIAFLFYSHLINVSTIYRTIKDYEQRI